MEAYSAGSRKKPHAAGSETGKKRPKKLEEVEKEPHAAGSKKKALLPDRTLEEMLQVEEPKDFLGFKWKTVKVQRTEDNVNHFEEYIPPTPYCPRDLDSTGALLVLAVESAAARHQARLENSKRAVQQFKEEGSAELELELLEECDDLSELKDFLNDPEV